MFLCSLVWDDPRLEAVLSAAETQPVEALRQSGKILRDTPRDSSARYALTNLAHGILLNRAEQYKHACRLLKSLEPFLQSLSLAQARAICRWQIGVAERFLRADPHFVAQLETAFADLMREGLLIDAARCRRDLAAAYNWQGKRTEAQTQIAQAREYFAQNGLTIDAAMCAFAESAQLRWVGKFDQAIQTLKEAEQVFETAGLFVERATVWLYQGNVYLDQIEIALANKCLESGRRQFRDQGLKARHAQSCLIQGNIALTQGKLTLARNLHRVALTFYKAAGMKADYAIAVVNCANDHYYAGQLSSAYSLYKEAREIYSAVNDLWTYALCEANIAVVQTAMGLHSHALQTFERGFSVMADINAQSYLSLAYHQRGKLWLDLGEIDNAEQDFEQAVRMYRESRSRFPAARSLVHLALAKARQGDLEKALKYLGEAREVCVEVGAEHYVAICDQAQGELFASRGDFVSAQESFQNAELSFAKLGTPINKWLCQIHLADVYLELSQLSRAEALYAAALEQTRSFPDIAWRGAYGLARIAESKGDHDRALREYSHAVEQLRLARHALHHELLVDAFMSSRREVFDRAIACAATYGDAPLSLSFAESARAQLLTLQLRSRHVNHFNEEQDPLRQQLQEVRRRLSAGHEASFIRPPDEEQQSLLKELERLNQLYHRRSASQSKELLDIAQFDLAKCRQTLSRYAGQDWACLIYHWLGERLCIFTLTPDKLDVEIHEPTPLQRFALEVCASPQMDRRRMMWNGNGGKRSHLWQLESLLLPSPARDHLRPDHLLFIIPTGHLHCVPFHLLTDGEHYLCERATLVYADSLESLRLVLENTSQTPAKIESALLVGVEHFDDGLTHLPCALEEVNVVSRVVNRPHILTNESATPETVSALLASQHYDTIHFATHAIYEAYYGELSRLVLYNGELQVDEIARMRCSARLITLSACHSAMGRTYRGDETVSLRQAFLLAGASSVLSTLWAVEDETTPRFIQDVYEGMVRKRLSPAHALSQAQRKWIAERGAVRAWGAFTIYGAP